MVKVRVFEGGKIKVKLKPEQGVKVGTDTTYLYDPTIIEAEVQQAKDWAIKTDGMVEEDGEPVDYSAKAYAIGGTGTQTNNAKYYSEQAGLSATSASDSATTATTQAGIATTQAGIATTQAGTATTQAGIATTQAGIATTASETATTQAGIATTKASDASGYASSANVSAQHASTSETNSQIWAEGSDAQVSLLGGEKSSKGWAQRAKEIVDSIGSVLHYKGSVATRADLPITGQVLGDMYNITSDGSNVVWNGSDWDDISGIVDLSAYRTASDQDTIDAGKVPTSRTVNGKALSSDISLTYSDVGAQQAGNYVTTNTVQTITEAKTFTNAVHFTGTGDTNAVFLTENTRFDIEGTTRTILGMGSAQFYINHSAYALLLRGKNARPSYNSATSYLALLSDLDGYVPNTRTVNGKALSSDISLTASDVGALPDSTVIPTVNNPTITLTQGGVTKGSFTLNQSTGGTIDLDAGGGGGSYTAGTGIDITNNVISVTSPTLTNTATGNNSLTILGTPTTAISAINIGKNTSSTAYGCVTIGFNNSATKSYCISIGESSVASGVQAISIGRGATSSFNDSICIGFNATTSNNEAISIGRSSWARGYRSIALGSNAQTASTVRQATALGYNAQANANNSIQLGYGTNTEANSFYVGTSDTNNWKMLGSDGKIPDDRINTTIARTSQIPTRASDIGALPDTTVIPTVNNPTITLTQGGTTKGSFTLNQSSGATIDLDAGGGSSVDIDNVSITKNTDDEIQTVGVIDQNNTTTALKQWSGTKAQYDAIATKDANTVYNITDDVPSTLNFYTKTETDSLLSNYATTTDLSEKIQLVSTLPATQINGILYVIPE